MYGGALARLQDHAAARSGRRLGATGEGIAAAVELVAAAARRRATAAGRRAQGRVWAELRLRELFGRVGSAALAPRLEDADSPFAPLAEIAKRARAAVHETFKEL